MLSKGYFKTLVKRIRMSICFHRYGDYEAKLMPGYEWPIYHRTCKKCGKWKYLD